MQRRFLYDPIKKKILKPIIKFNNGHGAILCIKCRKVIKQNLAISEFLGNTDLIFCDKCAYEYVMTLFKK